MPLWSRRGQAGKQWKCFRERKARISVNDITHEIIAAAIEVHRMLGPGLLESAYGECFCRELALRGISFERKRTLQVELKGLRLDCGFCPDLIVEQRVIVEIKAVASIMPIHEARMLTYLKLGGWKVGLLINFNVAVLKAGNLSKSAWFG